MGVGLELELLDLRARVLSLGLLLQVAFKSLSDLLLALLAKLLLLFVLLRVPHAHRLNFVGLTLRFLDFLPRLYRA